MKWLIGLRVCLIIFSLLFLAGAGGFGMSVETPFGSFDMLRGMFLYFDQDTVLNMFSNDGVPRWDIELYFGQPLTWNMYLFTRHRGDGELGIARFAISASWPVLAIGGLVVMCEVRRRKRRVAACDHCTYSLVGLKATGQCTVCPECGHKSHAAG